MAHKSINLSQIETAVAAVHTKYFNEYKRSFNVEERDPQGTVDQGLQSGADG